MIHRGICPCVFFIYGGFNMEITETKLWYEIANTITMFKDKIDKRILPRLKNLRLQLMHDEENQYTLVVSTWGDAAGTNMLTVVRMTLVMLYPNLDIKIVTPNTPSLITSILLKDYLEEFNVFERFSWGESSQERFYKTCALHYNNEALIKYAMKHASSASINDWMKYCDGFNLIEAKAMMLRYMKNKPAEELSL
jgi:hypothetical protein